MATRCRNFFVAQQTRRIYIYFQHSASERITHFKRRAGGALKIKCSFGGTLNHHQTLSLGLRAIAGIPQCTIPVRTSDGTSPSIWFALTLAIRFGECNRWQMSLWCVLILAHSRRSAPSLFNSQIAFSTSFLRQANRFARHYISFYAPQSFRCTLREYVWVSGGVGAVWGWLYYTIRLWYNSATYILVPPLHPLPSTKFEEMQIVSSIHIRLPNKASESLAWSLFFFPPDTSLWWKEHCVRGIFSFRFGL